MKFNLHKSIPTMCQKPSYVTGKNRHVSKNTITKSVLSDMKDHALYNRQLNREKIKNIDKDFDNTKDKSFIKGKDKTK